MRCQWYHYQINAQPWIRLRLPGYKPGLTMPFDSSCLCLSKVMPTTCDIRDACPNTDAECYKRQFLARSNRLPAISSLNML